MPFAVGDRSTRHTGFVKEIFGDQCWGAAYAEIAVSICNDFDGRHRGSNNFADRISSIGFAICVGIHEDGNSAFGTGIAKSKGIENNTIFVNIGLKDLAIRLATDAEIFQHILRFRIDVPAENRPTGSVTKIIMKCRCMA